MPTASVPLAEAQRVIAEVQRRLVFGRAGGRLEVIPVGSVRRGAARVKDLDFLVVAPSKPMAGILASARLRPPRAGDVVEFADTYAGGTRRRSLILRARQGGRTRRYRSDLFLTTKSEKAFALFHYTGSAAYNIRTRALAKRKGWRLNQYGLFDAVTGQRVRGSAAIRSERRLAAFLGVSYRPPQARG